MKDRDHIFGITPDESEIEFPLWGYTTLGTPNQIFKPTHSAIWPPTLIRNTKPKMNTSTTPKAYLVSCSESIENTIEDADLPHVFKINSLTYLVDAFAGHYLLDDLTQEGDIRVAAPIYESITGHFPKQAEAWLNIRGIQIRRVRA